MLMKCSLHLVRLIYSTFVSGCGFNFGSFLMLKSTLASFSSVWIMILFHNVMMLVPLHCIYFIASIATIVSTRIVKAIYENLFREAYKLARLDCMGTL